MARASQGRGVDGEEGFWLAAERPGWVVTTDDDDAARMAIEGVEIRRELLTRSQVARPDLT